jgi:hypothetical protein
MIGSKEVKYAQGLAGKWGVCLINPENMTFLREIPSQLLPTRHR